MMVLVWEHKCDKDIKRKDNVSCLSGSLTKPHWVVDGRSAGGSFQLGDPLSEVGHQSLNLERAVGE